MAYYHNTGRRVILLDELRGLCILLMVIFHGAYDVVYLFRMDIPIFHAPLLQNILQPFVAGIFIVISGIVCRYSRSNIKRGLIALGCGLLMTAVTAILMPEQLILFGILHLLGTCMILYGLCSREKNGRPDRLPAFAGVLLFSVLFLLTLQVPEGFLGIPGTSLGIRLPGFLYRSRWLSPLGFLAEGFYSADYFPLMPWMFLFFAGSFLGVLFHTNTMPEFFYRRHVPFLGVIGRYTLPIYLLHQPVVYGLLWLFFRALTLLGVPL